MFSKPFMAGNVMAKASALAAGKKGITMKKSSLVRSLAVLACVVGMSAGLCMAPTDLSASGFSWNYSESNKGQSSQSQNQSQSQSQSQYQSPSQSGNSQSSSGSGFNWGSSNSGKSQAPTNSAPSNSGGSWGSSASKGGSQQAASFQIDPFDPISLNDLNSIVKQNRGKIVIVTFFASWCGPCRQEISDLIALRQRMSQDDMFIIGVSIDENKNDLADILRNTGFNYPTAWANPSLKRDLNISSIPRMMVYDRRGNLEIDEVGVLPREHLFELMDLLVTL